MAAMAALQSSMTSLSLSSNSFLGERLAPSLFQLPVRTAEKPCAISAKLKRWERIKCKPNSLPVLHKMHVKLGDTVKIISGQEKGKISEVIRIFRHNSTIVVKDMNLKTKHMKSREQGEPGKIVKEDKYKNLAEDLKARARYCLEDELVDLVGKLELVDAIQRLGVGYQFEKEIKKIMKDVFIYSNTKDEDLFAMALRFRLLRQHGYDVTPDVFTRYKDEAGNFTGDVKGILYLYDASYLAFEGENILNEARLYTTDYLKNYVKENSTVKPTLAIKIAHSLEVPLHWRIPRVESRWYIDMYENEENMNPILLEFSKLDFNLVQAAHQREASTLAKWWLQLGVHDMGFSRDRLVEHFFWCIGTVSDPQYRSYREQQTKLNAMVTLIDDIYDVYGSFEELQVFTEAIERWDMDAAKHLPHYMKICYMALLNTSKEISDEILHKQGFDTKSHQKKQWTNLCKAYMTEAEWFHKGYTPTLDEYLNNAATSIAGPLSLMNCYFLTAEKITEEAIDYMEKLPRLVRSPSVIVRLANDLGNSSDELQRGDVPKSIQCYMHENGVSDEVARKHIKQIISESWKKMNEALFAQYPKFEHFVNGPRTAQHVYNGGDGHGIPKLLSKCITSLLVEPISLKL